MTVRYLRVTGRVQGVGYRFWAVRKALETGGISGYVYNDDDGDVLVCLSGEESAVTKMQAALYKGSMFSRVDSVEEFAGGELLFPPVKQGVFTSI